MHAGVCITPQLTHVFPIAHVADPQPAAAPAGQGAFSAESTLNAVTVVSIWLERPKSD